MFSAAFRAHNILKWKIIKQKFQENEERLIILSKQLLMFSHCPFLFTKPPYPFVPQSFLLPFLPSFLFSSLWHLQTAACTTGKEMFDAFQKGTWELLVCKNCEAASLWSFSATEGKKQLVQKTANKWTETNIYINNCWVEWRVSYHSEQKCGQYLLEVESHPSLRDFNSRHLGRRLMIAWEREKLWKDL